MPHAPGAISELSGLCLGRPEGIGYAERSPSQRPLHDHAMPFRA
jgi:hypothetical protein